MGKDNSSGARLGFESELWRAADALHSNMDAAEYKHVVLGLIFLKYISDAFMEKFTALQGDKHANPEDKDEYLADNIFWAPPEARWSYLQKNAKRPEIGTLVDDALTAIERDVLGRVYDYFLGRRWLKEEIAAGRARQAGGVPFEEKMAELSAELYEQMAKGEELDAAIRRNLEVLGYGQ